MITTVAVIGVVLACVAIAMSAVDKSTSEDYDDHEDRLKVIEQQLNTNGKAEKPDVSQIRPVEAFQISTFTNSDGNDFPASNALDKNDDTYMVTNRHTETPGGVPTCRIYTISRELL